MGVPVGRGPLQDVIRGAVADAQPELVALCWHGRPWLRLPWSPLCPVGGVGWPFPLLADDLLAQAALAAAGQLCFSLALSLGSGLAFLNLYGLVSTLPVAGHLLVSVSPCCQHGEP